MGVQQTRETRQFSTKEIRQTQRTANTSQHMGDQITARDIRFIKMGHEMGENRGKWMFLKDFVDKRGGGCKWQGCRHVYVRSSCFFTFNEDSAIPQVTRAQKGQNKRSLTRRGARKRGRKQTNNKKEQNSNRGMTMA